MLSKLQTLTPLPSTQPLGQNSRDFVAALICSLTLTHCYCLQTQLDGRQQQVQEQTTRLTDLTAQHEQLQELTSTQDLNVKSLQEQLQSTDSSVNELQTLLGNQATELKDAQHALEQKAGIVSQLQADAAARGNKLSAALRQVAVHEANSAELRQQLQNAKAELHKWQDSFEAQKAEGAEQLRTSRRELQQLQVTYLCTCIACMHQVLLLRKSLLPTL